MRKIKLLGLMSVFLFCLSSLYSMTGYQIMKKVDKIFKVRNSIMVSEMKIIDRDGTSRSFIQWGMVKKIVRSPSLPLAW